MHREPRAMPLADDVIVVGAGISGLVTAYRLTQQGFSVRVLEARDRVGGRILDHQSRHGLILPLGGTWLGHNEERLPALIAELGLDIIDEESEASRHAILSLHGRQRRFRSSKNLIDFDEFDAVAPEYRADVERLVKELERLWEQVPLETPYESPLAKTLDPVSVADWFGQLMPSGVVRDFFNLVVRNELTTDLRECSVLYFLFHWHGIVNQLLDNRRVRQGAQQICYRLADKLAERVILEAPVRAIHHDDNGVSVQSDAGAFAASHVVVTSPPVVARDINYIPALPEARREFARGAVMGSIIKCMMLYDRPFWREAGLSGTMMTDEGPLTSTADFSPLDASYGVLVGFLTDDMAKQWDSRTSEERRDAILQQLPQFFGPEAATPLEYVDQAWVTEPWTQGYIGSMRPGVMSIHGHAVRQPVGRIHWAGTETSPVWTGSMEGTVRSAERVVEEIVGVMAT